MTAWEAFKPQPLRCEFYRQFIEALGAQLHEATTSELSKHPVWFLI